MTADSEFDMPAQTAGTTHSEVTSVEPVIAVDKLNIYYGKFLAVRDVTMEIASRSITALIGPSGCGKSTFLRSLNRMHEVIPKARVEGVVKLNGEDIYELDVDPVTVRRRIGMVFQRPNPFPTMSIYENVLAGMRLNANRLSKSEQMRSLNARSPARPLG